MTHTNQRRILLVDHQKHMRETMAVLLNMEGYQVSTATHGIDALDRLELTAPDLIISDITPPHAAAFEFLSVVRRQLPSIPVISVSAADDSDYCFPLTRWLMCSMSKEKCRVDEFLRTVAQMIHTPVVRP